MWDKNKVKWSLLYLAADSPIRIERAEDFEVG
jgi:hypothetical protein